MSRMISTVTGEISVEELGITSAHEHIKAPTECRELMLEFQVKDLLRAKAAGLKTIVEVSPDRDIELLTEVSERTGVQIIPCTGKYTFSQEEKSYTVEKLYQLGLDEVEHGIGGSSERPGVIKVASFGAFPDDCETRAFLAAGRLQKDTGLPICVHSVKGCKRQQDLLEEAGADLSRVYFSHVEAEFGWEGRTLEEQLDYLESVVKKGSYLSYNNFGNWAHTRQEILARIISEMAARGYGDRQVATMVTVISVKEGEIRVLWDDINPKGKERTYSYLLEKALPWMVLNGISESDAHRMVCGNVAAIFA